MKKIFIIVVPIFLFCNNLILPDQNLFITRYKNLEYIYSNDINIDDIVDFQSKILDIYQNEFGDKLDSQLYVTISSNNNQIANGISTQIPLNSQFLYSGGSSYIDYFCFNSWSRNLLIHETAHNFQLNQKDNFISKYSNKIFGNVAFTYIGVLPIFPIPNIMINPFLLEGNAVLNESRFNNGGRLYSGYALAELIEMVNANRVKANLLYNTTLSFPYGEKNYLIGGFFQKYLAQKYGIDKTNSFFKKYSKQFLPISVNSVFKKHFGKSFETLIDDFSEYIKQKYDKYHRADGEILIDSKIYAPMGRNGKNILILAGNFRDYPKAISFDGKKIEVESGSFKKGKLFKIDNRYYTQATMQISPSKIKFGLFDKDGVIKRGTESKVIQGFLEDGKVVYFNVSKSFDIPHIYVNNRFFDTANSSIFINGNDIYYFKQKGEVRTLYKNKKPIFSYRGYYGFVADIQDNSIYFIAPTKNGSGIYIYNNGLIKRAISGDNIIDFKLINGNRAVINTIEDRGYIYKIAKIKPIKSQIPNLKKLKFSKKIDLKKNINLKSHGYRPIKNIKFSSLNQNFGFDSNRELFFNIQANFTDPTTYNTANISIYKDNKKSIGAIGYLNREDILKYEGEIYGANYKKGEDNIGYRLNLELPIVKRGYYSADIGIEYLREYDSLQRPFSIYFNIEDNRRFGISKYPSSLNSLNIFFTEDRDNLIYGFDYKKLFQFGDQNFIEFKINSIKSDKLNLKNEKGIKLSSNSNGFIKKPMEVEILNLDKNLYTKDITSFEVGLYKSFDTPLYYFSFPISLQRTTLYTKYKKYNIDGFKINTFGIESDIVFFNNFQLPINFEYVKTPYSRDKSIFRLFIGVEF